MREPMLFYNASGYFSPTEGLALTKIYQEELREERLKKESKKNKRPRTRVWRAR